MKSKIKLILDRYHIYYSLRYSFLYYFYAFFFNRAALLKRKKEIQFYRTILPKSESTLLVFDIGANIGDKADIFLSLGSSVVSAEPDPKNIAILKTRFKGQSIEFISKAVSSQEEVVDFYIHEEGSPVNTLNKKWVNTLSDQNLSRFNDLHNYSSSRKVETTTLEKMIEEFGAPWFIKLDIEGGELDALKGLRQKIPYISIELNLPEFKNEGLECLSILENLCPKSQFNYIGDDQDGFRLPQWMTAVQFREHLENTQDRFMEMFCQMNK